jgi:hypothetical protein
MGKVYVLDTETKGTGAHVVPLEKAQVAPRSKPARRAKPRSTAANRGKPATAPARPKPVERSATALPPGHVRKKSTGELGKVLAVDPRAGTVTVRWLRSGASSTVPLSAVARR